MVSRMVKRWTNGLKSIYNGVDREIVEGIYIHAE